MHTIVMQPTAAKIVCLLDVWGLGYPVEGAVWTRRPLPGNLRRLRRGADTGSSHSSVIRWSNNRRDTGRDAIGQKVLKQRLTELSVGVGLVP